MPRIPVLFRLHPEREDGYHFFDWRLYHADRSTASGSPERGWGQMLPCFLNGRIRVENHAACGRSSLSFIREGRWQAVLDRLQAGDYVIIQFGHNDEKTDTALHTVPGGSFDENLRRFVRETREKGLIPS